jgi:hypothetical protein
MGKAICQPGQLLREASCSGRSAAVDERCYLPVMPAAAAEGKPPTAEVSKI